jgi:hypothetical protein
MRHVVFAYEADDENAEVFLIVLGSVAENFRGVTIHEVVDETILGDGDDRGAIDALYQLITSEGRLTEEQQGQLERFGDELREWRGEE